MTFEGGRELRPKATRVQSEDRGLGYRAAVADRMDVLGPAGLLGLQRAVGNASVSALMSPEERSPVLDVDGSGGGSPLDAQTRTDMESRLGHDFGDVRVHTDSRVHDSARAVNAHAYTVGSNVVFQRDKYDPSSTEGRTMLAHELTHVVQQRSGPVEGTPTGVVRRLVTRRTGSNGRPQRTQSVRCRRLARLRGRRQDRQCSGKPHRRRPRTSRCRVPSCSAPRARKRRTRYRPDERRNSLEGKLTRLALPGEALCRTTSRSLQSVSCRHRNCASCST